MKLLDFLNKVIYKGKMPADFNQGQANLFSKTVSELSKMAEEIKGIDSELMAYGDKLIDSKERMNKAQDAISKLVARKDVETIAKKISETENRIFKATDKFNKTADKYGKKLKLTEEQIGNVTQFIHNNSSSLMEISGKTDKAFTMLRNSAKNGFNGILTDTHSFFTEFAEIGGIIGVVVEMIGESLAQMQEMRNKLVDFNRQMSLGFSNKMLGMDLYGNSANGSLKTRTGVNNIDEGAFLQSFQGINKGNAMGNTNKFEQQQAQMDRFGIAAAQLSKFYGVEMGTVNSITANLVYNFGAKIKDLNEVFEHGKESAMAAGVSVNEYFKNLEQASAQIGRHYITGGIQGLEKLSIYATKTGQTVNSMLASSDKFKDYTSIWQQQNLAAAHAMNQTAESTGKIWSLTRLGRQQEANQLNLGSMAKDVMNNGWVDKKNNIDYTGTQVLQGMNVSPEDIQAVNKLIKVQKELGISMEQYLNVDKQSVEIKKKVNRFEEQNIKTSEKLGVLWAKIKGSILDPISMVLAPLVDGLINALSIVVSIIGPIVKAVMWPIKQLGELLGWVSDTLEDLYYDMKPAVDWFGKVGDKLKELWGDASGFGAVLKYLVKAVMAVGGGMLTWWALRSGAGLVGQAGGFIGNMLGRGAGSGVGGLLSGGLSRAGIAGTARNIWQGARGLMGSGLSRAGGWLGSLGSRAGNVMSAGRGLMGRIPGVGALGEAAASPIGGGLLKLARGGFIGAGVAGLGNMLGKKAGGKEGETVSTVGNWAGAGAMIGSLVPVLGTAVGAAIGGIAGLIKTATVKVFDVWSDDSKTMKEKLLGTYDAINGTAKDFFNGLWKGLKNMFSSLWNWMTGEKDKEETAKANAAVSKNYHFADPRVQMERIMTYRKDEYIQHKQTAERAYEDRYKKETHVNVNVNVDPLGKNASYRVNNKA